MARQKWRIASGTEELDGHAIDFEIWEERRRDTRFSMTARKAFLRMPYNIAQADKIKQVEAFRVWLAKTIVARPDLAAAQVQHEFSSGQTWSLGDRRYKLSIEEVVRKSGSAKILEQEEVTSQLSLKLPVGLPGAERSRMIEQLLWRLSAKQALPWVESLLDEENDTHFQVKVGRIKLSPTTSRWGSCSSTGNINISSRLLGAPERCMRAVIVHELAHRIEMNHSKRFWKLVYDAMPEYDEAHDWLQNHGTGIAWRLVG